MQHGAGNLSHRKHRIAKPFGRSSRSNVAQAVARDVNALAERRGPVARMYASIADALRAERGRP